MTKIFQARLKNAREKRGLSQRELAERCGVGERQVWRYENGRSEPTLEPIIKICDALNTTADYLLGYDDEDSPSAIKLSYEEYTVVRQMRDGQYIDVVLTMLNKAKEVELAKHEER